MFGFVMNSKMPKGVEHLPRNIPDPVPEKVMNSKMPKGVEHRSAILSRFKTGA